MICNEDCLKGMEKIPDSDDGQRFDGRGGGQYRQKFYRL